MRDPIHIPAVRVLRCAAWTLPFLVLTHSAPAQLDEARRIAGPTVAGGSLLGADLDGDGRVDLVSYGGEVGWFRNLGGGAFTAATEVLAEGSLTLPHQLGVAVADGDRDGDLDLYVGTGESVPNTADTRWSLRRIENLGGGALDRGAVVASLGFEVSGMALVDLDGDAILDLVTAQRGQSTTAGDVGWQRGLGASSFGPRVQLALVPDARTVRAIDLDGDSDIDLLVQSFGATAVALQNSGGAFSPAAALDATGLVGAALRPDAADLDADGDRDVFLAGTIGGTVWFERVGGAYAPARVIGSPESAAQALTASETVAADLDGDGDLDFVSARREGFVFAPSVAFGWYENLGAGSFGPVRSLRAVTATADDHSPVVSDFDGDGRVDVASSNSPFGPGPGWFQGLGGGAFGGFAAFPSPSLELARELLAGDIDGDGHLDVLTDLLSGGLSAFRGQGGGAFGAPAFVAPPVFGRASLRDVDVDGDLDLLEFDGTLRVRRNDGAGVFGARETLVSGLSSFAFGDIDGDGDADLVAARPVAAAPGRLAWYPNLGGAVFGAGIPLPSNADVVLTASVLDYDNDGQVDVVYATTGPRVRVLRNLGSSSFGPSGTANLAWLLTSISGLDPGDIDGDGLVDLLVRSSPEDALLRNTGSGFEPFLSPGGQPVALLSGAEFGDLDLDGQLELLTPWNLTATEIAQPVVPGDARPLRPVAELNLVEHADVDGDGRSDVLAVSARRELLWYPARYGVTEELCAPATTNASGRPGRLELAGSTRAADNDVTLVARDLNPGSACVLAVSAGFGEYPGYRGSIGTFCLYHGRFGLFTGPQQVQIADAAGMAQLHVDLLQPLPVQGLAPVVAGATLGFQMWYRDQRPGGGSASNFTSALRVTFD